MLAGKQVIILDGAMTAGTANRKSGEAAKAIGAAAGQDSPQAEEFTRLRAAIGKLGRRLRTTQAGAGLSPSQISVLFTIVRRGPIGLSEVASLEALNPTMLSRITAQLTEAGLIRRSAASHDRRAAVVEATPAGRRLRERIHRERTKALEVHVSQLPEREQERLWQALPALEELAEMLARERR
jgi:DNA-binding MarR family transcriptional regulator